jgi:hypothetical protein
MKHFVDCIQNDRNPSVSGYDGKMAAIMGYAAKESFSKKEFVGIKNN